MVASFMKQPYQFYCLDDSPYPGWWAKISLFEPGRFEGRVFYLDLDVTVTGNLDCLADYPGEFVICRDWGRFGYNSSVMAWDVCKNNYPLSTAFEPWVMEKYRGDQDWITVQKPDAVKFPRDWCYSYRLGLKAGFPDDMRVCVYHGRPKPWELSQDDLETRRA